MEIKSGWKTTEFWTSIATAIAGVLVLFGYMTPAGVTGLAAAATQISGAIVSVIPVATYAFSRAKTKSGEVDVKEQIKQVVQVIDALKPKTQIVEEPQVLNETKVD